MAGTGTAHLRAEATTRCCASRTSSSSSPPAGGKVHAVSDISLDVARGRDARARRRVGLRQVDDRPRDHAAPAAHVGHGAASTASSSPRCKGERPARDPPADADDLPGPDLVAEPAPQGRRHRRRGPRDLGDRRQGGARRPRSTRCSSAVGLDPDDRARPPAARVLRRPVPAHLDRPRGRHRAEADHLRRAGLRARRVGAGADPQPARGHEGSATGSRCLHRPRPRGREERQRPRRGDVPRQAVRGRRRPTMLYAQPAHPYTAALLAAIPVPDPDARAPDDHAGVLGGEIPSPINPPSGCRFRTRCPQAQERCAEEEPQLARYDRGRGASSWPATSRSSPASSSSSAVRVSTGHGPMVAIGNAGVPFATFYNAKRRHTRLVVARPPSSVPTRRVPLPFRRRRARARARRARRRRGGRS